MKILFRIKLYWFQRVNSQKSLFQISILIQEVYSWTIQSSLNKLNYIFQMLICVWKWYEFSWKGLIKVYLILSYLLLSYLILSRCHKERGPCAAPGGDHWARGEQEELPVCLLVSPGGWGQGHQGHGLVRFFKVFFVYYPACLPWVWPS